MDLARAEDPGLGLRVALGHKRRVAVLAGERLELADPGDPAVHEVGVAADLLAEGLAAAGAVDRLPEALVDLADQGGAAGDGLAHGLAARALADPGVADPAPALVAAEGQVPDLLAEDLVAARALDDHRGSPF